MKTLKHSGPIPNRPSAAARAALSSIFLGSCGSSAATSGEATTDAAAETLVTSGDSSETSPSGPIVDPCPASTAVHTIQVKNGGETIEWPYVVYSWTVGDCTSAVNIVLFPDGLSLGAAVDSGDRHSADSYLEITFFDAFYTSSEKWTVPAKFLLKRPGGGGSCDGEISVAHYEPLSYGGSNKPWPFLVGSVNCLSGDLEVLGGLAAPLCGPLVESCP